MAGIAQPFGLAPRARGWVEFALGTPVVLWCGWPILRKFWLSLAHRAAGDAHRGFCVALLTGRRIR
jgi:Cu+-exporting ATPase